jgi:hypothetical protein
VAPLRERIRPISGDGSPACDGDQTPNACAEAIVGASRAAQNVSVDCDGLTPARKLNRLVVGPGLDRNKLGPNRNEARFPVPKWILGSFIQSHR